MIKCGIGCTPNCDFCTYVVHEKEDVYILEPIECRLHPEEAVSSGHSCDDFVCFRAMKRQSQQKQGT